MRKASQVDFDEIGPLSVSLPAHGERFLRDAKVPRLALRLRSTGARKWVLSAKRNARLIRVTLGDVKEIPVDLARRIARTVPDELPDIQDPRRSPIFQFARTARVVKVLASYLASGAGHRWKPGTMRNMEAAGRMLILPAFGQKRVGDITPDEVARWYRDISKRTTGARTALSTLSGMMVYAEDHGLRPPGSNPCRGLRKKQISYHTRRLSNASIRSLWSTMEKLEVRLPDACDAVRLLLLTGARRSEILGLTWDQIIGSRAVLNDSKTGPGTIWLSATAREILGRRKVGSLSRFVFPAPRSEGHIKAIDTAWRVILDEAGIPPVRVHDLRHHFASAGVSNGIDLHIVGQLLRHRDIDSTLGYAHLATSALIASASRVSTVIEQSLSASRVGPESSRPVETTDPAAAIGSN